MLAAVTLISSVAAVTLRSPVYCAVWFGLSLVGTAGLLLFQGAQFLAVATIVVYAGAILVTFLFVLMLAHSTGRAYYDRLSWEPLMSAVTGAVLVGILTTALFGASRDLMPGAPAVDMAKNILAEDHVAHLGGELFSRYLVGVELAGTLLLVALVGAIAMVSHETQPGRTAGGEAARRMATPRAVPPVPQSMPIATPPSVPSAEAANVASTLAGAEPKEPVHG